MEALCEEANVPSRFSEILKSHPTILLAADFSYLAGIIFISVIVTRYFIEIPNEFSSIPAGILFVHSNDCGISRRSITLNDDSLDNRTNYGRTIPANFLANHSLATFFPFPPDLGLLKIDEISHRLAGKEESKNGREANISEEILSVVEEGERGGILETGAGKMIQRVMELQDEDVAAIMTQRMDMEYISVNATLDEALLKFIDVGHSRIPVIGKSTDDIVGILYARELLKHYSTDYQNSNTSEKLTIQSLMFQPFYIPETTGIDSLLQTMQKEHVHMAIVIDEYGGVQDSNNGRCT